MLLNGLKHTVVVGWPAIKLVLELPFSLGQDRFDVFLRVCIRMSYMIRSHAVLYEKAIFHKLTMSFIPLIDKYFIPLASVRTQRYTSKCFCSSRALLIHFSLFLSDNWDHCLRNASFSSFWLTCKHQTWKSECRSFHQQLNLKCSHK